VLSLLRACKTDRSRRSVRERLMLDPGAGASTGKPYDDAPLLAAFGSVLGDLIEAGSKKRSAAASAELAAVLSIVSCIYSQIPQPPPPSGKGKANTAAAAFANAASGLLSEAPASPSLQDAALLLLLTPPALALPSSPGTLSAAVATYVRASEAREHEGDARLRLFIALGALPHPPPLTLLLRSPRLARALARRYLSAPPDALSPEVCGSILRSPSPSSESKCAVFTRLSEGGVASLEVATLLFEVLESGVEPGAAAHPGWFARELLKPLYPPPASSSSLPPPPSPQQSELLRVAAESFKGTLRFTLASPPSALLTSVLTLAHAIASRVPAGAPDLHGVYSFIYEAALARLTSPDPLEPETALLLLLTLTSSALFKTVTPQQIVALAKLSRKVPRAWEVLISAAPALPPSLTIQCVLSLLPKKDNKPAVAASMVLAVKRQMGWRALPRAMLLLGDYVGKAPVLWSVEYLSEVRDGGEPELMGEQWIQKNEAFVAGLVEELLLVLEQGGEGGGEVAGLVTRLFESRAMIDRLVNSVKGRPCCMGSAAVMATAFAEQSVQEDAGANSAKDAFVAFVQASGVVEIQDRVNRVLC
jgi:hypothetical protein